MEKIDCLDIAKFWMNVKIDNSTVALRTATEWLGFCWIWNGHFFQNGYGRFCLNGKAYKAHRVAFLIYHGKIPEKKFICHRCDSPKCVNPLHLFSGTARENTHDMLKKNRINRNRSNHTDSLSEFAGISLRKESGKWRARIMRDYRTVWCKEFSTEKEAHLARQAQLEVLFS